MRVMRGLLGDLGMTKVKILVHPHALRADRCLESISQKLRLSSFCWSDRTIPGSGDQSKFSKNSITASTDMS